MRLAFSILLIVFTQVGDSMAYIDKDLMDIIIRNQEPGTRNQDPELSS
jgi:hypothetical protein